MNVRDKQKQEMNSGIRNLIQGPDSVTDDRHAFCRILGATACGADVLLTC